MTFISGLAIVFMCLLFHSVFGPNKTGERFDAYFFIVLTLTIVTSSFPIRHELFQRKIAYAVEELLDGRAVFVDCNSYFDSVYHYNASGYVYKGSSEINLEVRTCDDLKSYLSDPSAATSKEQLALHVLTHEAMHVAGEFNEKLTDCQAFQRNHKMAELLGVSREIAVKHAVDIHRNRSKHHPYYTPKCEPGKEMDERLQHAVWVGSNSR